MATAKTLLDLADAKGDLSLRCAHMLFADFIVFGHFYHYTSKHTQKPDFTSPENADYLLVFENFTFTIIQH